MKTMRLQVELITDDDSQVMDINVHSLAGGELTADFAVSLVKTTVQQLMGRSYLLKYDYAVADGEHTVIVHDHAGRYIADFIVRQVA